MGISANDKVLLIRGGAIAAGKGCERSYVDFLLSMNAFPGYRIIKRVNESDNSFDGVWSFNEEIAPFEPDVLILHFGMNDAYSPVYRSEFKENLVQIVRRARKNYKSFIALMTSHPFDDPDEMTIINIYYRTIREVATDLDCMLIPVHTYFRGYLFENHLNLDNYVQDDNRLPNEQGHLIYANAIMAKLAGKL